MRGKRWMWLAVLLILIAPGAQARRAAATVAERGGAFTLAVLRRDGLLLPFAAYDGKQWKNPWPVPEKHADAPIRLSDISSRWWPERRPILDWTLWPADPAAKQQPLHVTGPEWFPAYCLQGVGLRTDYKPAVLPPPPMVQPYPKDGLAVAGDVKISPVTIVSDRNDRVAQDLQRQLHELILPMETAQVRAYLREDQWQHSYTDKERTEVRPQLEALYRAPHSLDGRDVYYFEAVKRYFLPKGTPPPGTEPTCDLVTFAAGWFTSDATGKIRDLVPRTRVTSCDYQGAAFMLPFGTITLNGKTLWIAQWSNWRGESYAIVEPQHEHEGIAAERLFETPGGGCVQ